jgi:hypothetical protein
MRSTGERVRFGLDLGLLRAWHGAAASAVMRVVCGQWCLAFPPGRYARAAGRAGHIVVFCLHGPLCPRGCSDAVLREPYRLLLARAQQLVNVDADQVLDVLAHARLARTVEPAVERTFDALRAVEPEVEASVVGVRVRDHELDRVLREERRGREEGLVSQYPKQQRSVSDAGVGMGKEGVPFTVCSSAFTRRRHGILELGRAKVDIVDAEQVHVFVMLRERRPPRPEV